MAKCEELCLIVTMMVISIKQTWKATHPFLFQASVCYIKFLYIKFLLHQVLTTTRFVHVRIVMYCSLANSGRLIWIARSWNFASRWAL